MIKCNTYYIIISTCLTLSLSLEISHLNQNRRQVFSNIAYASSSSFLTLPQSSIAATMTAESLIIKNVPSIELSTPSKLPSKKFPLASFGLQIYDNDVAYKLTETALNVGYRNFFASVLAGNQKGFAQAIKDSNIPRDEIYICGTVLSNRANTYKEAYDKTYKGCLENYDVMNKYSDGKIDYLDMIMLDYPCTFDDGVKGQWEAFNKFLNEDKVVHLAVSNFSSKQLDICADIGPAPTVNQLPFSIANHPKSMIDYNIKRNVHVQSWSPLSSTLPRYKSIMTDIGKKYNKNAAQVGLRWIIQNGSSYCVQSKKASHFEEDLNVFDFELSKKDMDTLTNLQPPVSFS